jgi:hypothetical protein
LKADLQKAKQDISSYKEIIKILLEEQSTTQQQQQQANEHRGEEETFHQIPRGTSRKAKTGINWKNIKQVTPITNKFEILSNMKELNEVTCSTSATSTNNVTSKKSKKECQKTSQRFLQKKRGNNNPGKKRHRILLLGDSHARKCLADLQHNLGDDYEVTSFVKPGAGVERNTQYSK